MTTKTDVTRVFNRIRPQLKEQMRQDMQDVLSDIVSPNPDCEAAKMRVLEDMVPAGGAGRTRPAWEREYEINRHHWTEDERKLRTPEADHETVRWFQAMIDRDYAKLREIETRQVRPAHLQDEHQRAISTSSGGAGLVPQAFYNMVALLSERVAKMRSLCTVIPFTGGDGSTMKIPKVGTQPVPVVVAEGGDLTSGTTDPAITSVTGAPIKIGQVIKMSRELTEDSPLATVNLLAGLVSEALGNAEDYHILNGTPTDLTDNFEDDATASSDTFDDDAETLATLASKLYELPLDAVNRATWLINVDAAEALTALADTNARQVFLPFDAAPDYIGSQEGGAGMLLGRPVRVFPTAIVPANVAFVGDCRAYGLVDREFIRVAVSNDAYFTTDEVGLHVSRRLDGVMMQASKIRKHPAS